MAGARPAPEPGLGVGPEEQEPGDDVEDRHADVEPREEAVEGGVAAPLRCGSPHGSSARRTHRQCRTPFSPPNGGVGAPRCVTRACSLGGGVPDLDVADTDVRGLVEAVENARCSRRPRDSRRPRPALRASCTSCSASPSRMVAVVSRSARYPTRTAQPHGKAGLPSGTSTRPPWRSSRSTRPCGGRRGRALDAHRLEAAGAVEEVGVANCCPGHEGSPLVRGL